MKIHTISLQNIAKCFLLITIGLYLASCEKEDPSSPYSTVYDSSIEPEEPYIVPNDLDKAPEELLER